MPVCLKCIICLVFTVISCKYNWYVTAMWLNWLMAISFIQISDCFWINSVKTDSNGNKVYSETIRNLNERKYQIMRLKNNTRIEYVICICHVTDMQLARDWYVTVTWLSCDCHVTVMWLTMLSSSYSSRSSCSVAVCTDITSFSLLSTSLSPSFFSFSRTCVLSNYQYL